MKYLSGLMLVALLMGGLLGYALSKPSEVTLRETIREIGGLQPNGDNFSNGAQLGDVKYSSVKLTMKAGEVDLYWKNTTGERQFVSNPEVYMSLASSTFDFIAGTSTASSISNSTLLPYYALMDASLASTTNALSKVATSSASGILVEKNEYVVLKMLSDGDRPATIGASTCDSSAATGCYVATSTYRGSNPQFRFNLHN